MDKKLYKGVLIFAEQKNSNIEKISYELLNIGRQLADKLSADLSAVVLGKNIKNKSQELISRGCDKVYVYDNAVLENFQQDIYTNILSELVEKQKPEIFLIGATYTGCSFAPQLAAKLNTGLTAHVSSLEVDETTKNLKQIRPAFGKTLMVNIITPQHRPQISTVKSNIFKPAVIVENRKGEIIECTANYENILNRAKFVKFVKSEIIETDISDAEIVVAGGRGVGTAKGFELLKEFAALIGAKVGASRPPVDCGLIPHSYQIGQTGKSISPKIYIACAISGQIHHTIGIGNPDIIVAINKDPDCPMMQRATYALQVDMYEIIPAIMMEINKKNVLG
ncbi:MAG: electron transfer flavoprotein subunit alpha/FixB family protein [Elusimicrobiota bacterium]|jgi:electron transfer flavoprotein alpha subunit|nr:electron transfer flavoprotein subunit alpha/FixB family protein [Elusimicrobiota bacterium]